MTKEAEREPQFRLSEVFSRRSSQLDWMQPLQAVLGINVKEKPAAIGFDTNALKYLRRDKAAATDVLVYLESESIPVIIPGQASQEFWNNHAVFVSDVEQLVTSLNGVIKKIDRVTGAEDPSARLAKSRDDIAAVTADFQDAQNPNLVAESVELWQKMLTLATVPFVDRERFASIARVRFDTKTPPGFGDEKKVANQFGDFFVWADFLLGLLDLNLPDVSRRVVFVTSDQKKQDWMSFGVPHPILMGELYELSGQLLDIVKPEDFASEIRDVRAS